MSKIMDAREEFYYQQSSQPPNSQPPTFEQLPGTGQIVEGSDAHFECRIRGNPPPTVTWSRKGVPVLSDQRRRVVFDAVSGLCTLTIRNLTTEDDGEYKCTAVNVAGEASLTINIQRNDPNARRQVSNIAGQRQEIVQRSQSAQSASFVSQQVASQTAAGPMQQMSRSQISKQESFSSSSSQVLGPGSEPAVQFSPRAVQVMQPVAPLTQHMSQSTTTSKVVQQRTVREVVGEPVQAPQRQESLVRQQVIEEQQRQMQSELEQQQKVVQEQVRQQQLKQEQQRQEQIRQEQQRQEHIRKEKVRQEQIRLEQIRREQMRQEQIRQEQVRQEQLRQEQARQEQLRQERARQEQIRREQERQEKLRQEQIRQEQMRLEQEKQAAIHRQQVELKRRQDEQRAVDLQRKAEQRIQSQVIQQSHVSQKQEVRVQKSYQEQQVLHQPDSLPQQQTVHHMQKVTSQTMVHRSQETRIVEQEEKENQEQIFLKHLVPNQYIEEESRKQETVKLRHVVPSCQFPDPEPPQQKQVAPRFTHVCQDITILEGQVARFDCKYEPISDPYLRVEWYHKDRPLVQGCRSQAFAGSGHVFLNINSCVKEDSGAYVCVATNKVGTDRVQINLTVIDKSELALNELDEEARLAMEKFQVLEDENRFQRETQVEEERRMAPRFLTAFKSLRLNEGETAHFECRIEPTDDPTLRVLWFHDQQELQAGSRWQHFHDFGFISLNIMQCVEQDTGSYVCRIVNSEGFAESTVTLQVIGSSTLRMETINPDSMKQISYLEDDRRYQSRDGEEEGAGEVPKFLTKFRDQRINEREAAHFEARFEPVDDPTLRIDWFLNGKELQVGSRWQHFHDFGFVCLNILKCVTEDTGEYVCRLANSSGFAEQSVRLEVTSFTETIDREAMEKFKYLEDANRFKRGTESDDEVRLAPRFLTRFQDVNLPEGHTAHFECRIEPANDPRLRVEWFFDDKELTVGSRFQHFHDFGFISLNILQCVAEDTGTYTCRITNDVGSVSQSVHLTCSAKSSLLLQSQHPDSLQQIQFLEDGRRYARTEVSTPVIGAPRFLTKFKDQTIFEREACHVESRIEPVEDPHLRVEWFRDGVELPAGSRWQPFYDFGFVCLNVLQAVAEDSGLYTCRATNDVGSAEESFRLEVQVSTDMSAQGMDRFRHLEEKRRRESLIAEDSKLSPRFLTPFHDVELRESQAAHFECRIEPVNDSSLRVEWLFNGKELTVGHRFQPFHDFGFVSLNILQCVEEDTGSYTCRITNEIGSAEQSVSLKIYGLSSLLLETQHPDSLQQIQHLEDGRRYERSEVADPAGGPPRFLTPFKDIIINEGQIGHFECRIEPVTDPKLKVEWFRDGKLMAIGSRYQYVHDFGFVCMNILQTIAEDTGRYTCRLTNDYGSAESSVDLTVRDSQSLLLDSRHPSSLKRIRDMEGASGAEQTATPEPSAQPPSFVKPLENITVHERQVAHFEAYIEPTNDPTLKVEWFFNGDELSVGSRWQHFHDFGFLSLNILQCLIQDTGTYTCRVTNSAGSIESTVQLTVMKETIIESLYSENILRLDQARAEQTSEIRDEKQTAPRFLTQFQELQLSENQVAHFECRIEPVSDPTLRVEWFRNGKLLQVGSRYHTFHDFGYVFLNISQVVSEDSGEYICRLTNAAGVAEQSARATVSEKENILTDSQHPEGLQRIIQLEDYSRYITEQWELEQQGDFKQQRMAPVFVLAPEPVVCVEGDSVKFQCRIIGYPRPRIMWVLNGAACVNGSRFKLNYDGIYHLEIPKTRMTDDGKLEVFARNIVGEAHCFTSLQVLPKNSDYRAVLKNSPRPWYDTDHVRYQKERYASELEKVFEEKLAPGGADIKVWRTEQATEGHVKVLETLSEDEARKLPPGKAFKTDVLFVDKASTAKNKREDESNVSWMAKSYQKHVGADSQVEGRDTSSVVQKQVQKERQGDMEITRNITQKDTLEHEHRSVVQEVKVSGEGQGDGVAPVFTQKVNPVVVKAGQDAVFRCLFVGKPSPSVTWLRENSPIQQSNKYQIHVTESASSLTIRTVSSADCAVYAAKVENRNGTAKCSANLVLEAAPKSGGAPTFVKTIQPVSGASVGQLIRLDAKITGSPPIEVQWLRDGEEVVPDITHKVLKENDVYTLLILEATAIDRGVYDCVATNAAGEARCRTSVDIKAANGRRRSSASQVNPPTMQEPLQSVSAVEGKSVTFKTRISEVDSSSVVWRKDGNQIKPSRYFRIAIDGEVCSLTIAEAFPEDEGEYTCQVTNRSGTVTTAANLSVGGSGAATASTAGASPPSLTPLKSLRVTEGSSARFETVFKGSPTPVVTWMRDDVVIEPSRDFQMTQENSTCSLLIKQTFLEDSGVLTCRVKNPLGEAKASAELVVVPKNK